MLLLIAYVQTGIIVQKWYADDGFTAGKLTELREFFYLPCLSVKL